MNRGSDFNFDFNKRIQTGFNEAPIHESGKYPSRDGASLPGPASMRPRFMNRGSERNAPNAL